MQRLSEQLGPEGLRVVAVSIDVDPADKVLEWVEARGLTFDILHDRRGKIQRIYQTTGVPEKAHIWCACHNGHFDLNNVAGPPPRPLDAYVVNVRGE